METPKTFKELFANTGIEPTTDESGNTHYNFKATLKEEPKQGTMSEAIKQVIDKHLKKDRTCTNNCSDVCGECQIFEPKQETLEEDLDEIKNIRLWLKNKQDLCDKIIFKKYKNK